ncbi:hypothetical protein E2C01_036044 [Portunus trituberculatus]|uniref:Uncharacterized protein n=1 Tax=Portunus trituberculatus TaxID=210409 RepID=A0A5B7FBD5_PORTR|nr:hypothetical protein [Portunus trituberculatus]
MCLDLHRNSGPIYNEGIQELHPIPSYQRFLDQNILPAINHKSKCYLTTYNTSTYTPNNATR